MKKAIIAAGVMLAIMLFAFQTANAGHKVITGPELEAMMKDGSPVVVVDVREPELFAKGHVPGAINIPYDGAHTRVLKELKAGDRIVFVCHGGPMGDELGEILTKNGYKQVYNVAGGMKRWKGPLAR